MKSQRGIPLMVPSRNNGAYHSYAIGGRNYAPRKKNVVTGIGSQEADDNRGNSGIDGQWELTGGLRELGRDIYCLDLHLAMDAFGTTSRELYLVPA